MALLLTPYRSAAWPSVTRFLEEATDPVRDLLLWADVASPLGRLSRIWRAEAAGEVRALACAFPIWEDLAAFGVRGRSPADERAMLAAIAEARLLPEGFVIADPAQRPMYEALGTVQAPHREAHMVLEAASWQRRPTPHVRPATLDELDAFYRRFGAEAWNPAQFETGPFVVAEVEGVVAAAAGTHFAYDRLAQVGNVYTAPAFRGRGLARRVTEGVVQALVDRGHPTISLFVAEDNAPARRLYASLGFQPLRLLDAFRWTPTK